MHRRARRLAVPATLLAERRPPAPLRARTRPSADEVDLLNSLDHGQLEARLVVDDSANPLKALLSLYIVGPRSRVSPSTGT
jgi:hypothetical protein